MVQNKVELADTARLLNEEQAAKEFGVNYVVSGNCDDAAWEAWKEKAKSLNADRLVEIYNEAQKRYDAK